MMVSCRPFRLPIVILVLALAGCAVTKIDVDVYKGPLANEQKVQLEQMAVMAVGAKPILMRLRDELEVTHLRQHGQKVQSIRDVFGQTYGDCILDLKVKTQYFKSDNARRVNAILCLYENQSDSDRLRTRAREAIRTYSRAWRTFERGHPTWKKFRKAIYPEFVSNSSSDATGQLRPDHPIAKLCDSDDGGAPAKCYEPLINLGNAYSKLLTEDGPEKGATSLIREAHRCVFKAGLWSTDDPLYSLMEQFAGEHDIEPGANWTYRFLSGRRLVEAHADLLFKNRDEWQKEGKEFVAAVTSKARSFITARSALRDLLQINLDMLIALGQRSEPASAQDNSRKKRIAESLSLLIGRGYFHAIAISAKKDEDRFSARLRDLAQRARDGVWILSRDPDDIHFFKNFLFRRLVSKPLETAYALREADLALPDPSLPTGGYDDAKLKHMKPAARRRFGLARAVDSLPTDDVTTVDENLGPAATGLEGGRLSDGLETMIKDLLTKDDDFGIDGGTEATAEAHRLRHALVRFAQKVLFVADYDALLADSERGTEIKQYVQVLQAVGNSILNQANELEARETHRELLKKSAGHARQAAKRVLDRTPQETIAAILEGFVAEWVNAKQPLEAAEIEVEITGAKLRSQFRELDPYVDQNLQPEGADLSWPKPSEITDRVDGGPLKEAKDRASDAQDFLCALLTDHVINTLSARLTFTAEGTLKDQDEELYNHLRNHNAGDPCPGMEDAKGLLGGLQRWPRDPGSTVPSHFSRVRGEMKGWDPEGEDGTRVLQDPSAVRKRIVDFLEDLQKEIPNQEDPDFLRLKRVVNHLGNLPLGAIARGRPIEVFNMIVDNLIRRHWQSAASNLLARSADLAQAQVGLEHEQNTLEKRKISYRDAFDVWKHAESERKELADSVQALETAVAAINELKPTVIARTLSANLPNNPSATFLLLKSTVKEKLDLAEQGDKLPQNGKERGQSPVDRWRILWQKLDSMNVPTSLADDGEGGFEKDKNSREVLDRMISMLEYERIETVRQSGASSDRAGHIVEALNAAYGFRAGMAFIRPASSYLRSSFPAASLQDDPELSWRNELSRHSFQSIPFIGSIYTKKQDDGSGIDPAVQSQIDRQFWQSINNIRVSGGGRTNYVMVQDDIGNWYVKGYSADPQDIFDSVRGLGELALGRQLETDLVNRPEPGQSASPSRQPTALEAVFEKHKAEYELLTAQTFKDVRLALEKLPSDVQKSWEDDPRTEKVRQEAIAQLAEAKFLLDEARNELAEDDSNKPEQVAQRPARIVLALRAMERYRRLLLIGIRHNAVVEPQTEAAPAGGAPTEGTPSDGASSENVDAGTRQPNGVTQEEIDAIIGDLNAVVETKLRRFLERRENAVKAYESAIVFSGEVAGEVPATDNETIPR